MYDDLVKKLRHCENEISCNDCEYTYHCGGEKMNIGEAADAIEDLQGFLGEAERDRDEYMERMDKMADLMPRWVSGKDKLPEEAYGCLMAIIWDSYGDDSFLNYYPELIGWDGEQWNDYEGEEIPLEVVYWMKLPTIPEPPEEET